MFASHKLQSRLGSVLVCIRRASSGGIWSQTRSRMGKLTGNNINSKLISNHRHSTQMICCFCFRSRFHSLGTGGKHLEQKHCSGMTYSLMPWQQKQYYSNGELSDIEYDKLAEETLEHLCDIFEEIGDTHDCSPDYDVTYGDGVLTVKFGAQHGTYVINKQTPNKHIWLSSPTSGPKRYDYMDNIWIYKHDSSILHDLLTKEISQILNASIDFTPAKEVGER